MKSTKSTTVKPLAGSAVLPPLTEATPPRPKRRKRPTSDRFAMLNRFIDFTMRELTRSELVAWLTLFRDTKQDKTAQTGQADIGRRGGASKRAVQTALKQLETKGLVTIRRRGRLNTGASVYSVQGSPK